MCHVRLWRTSRLNFGCGRECNMCADGIKYIFFAFSIGYTWALACRGRRRRRPAKILKETFLLSYFCMTKSTKSHQRERSPLFENSSRVHELVARSSAWQARAAKGQSENRRFCALRNLNHTTRANIAHEKAEQIRARIVCTPAESAWRA